MDIASTEANTLTIQRLRAEYLVSGQHPSPEKVKARLDEAVMKSLPQTLAALAEQWVSASDSRVLLIRRLEIDIDVNAAWDRDVLARNWAAQIMHSLDDIRQGKGSTNNIVWFEDRAAYLAHFLVDVANGSAWGKWYYEPFDGLRMLPTSAALRTALCNQPSIGRAALLQLNELSNVLQALTAQDTRRVVESLDAGVQASHEEDCLQVLWAAWDKAALGSVRAGDEWRNVLRLYLDVVRDHAELAGETLKTVALALLRLARRCISASPATFKTILTALRAADVSALYVTAGTGDAEVLMPLMRCSADRLQKVGEALRFRYTDQGVDTTVVIAERRYTPFGGLFLLLPILDDIPLEQATQGWPDAGDTPAVALSRFLLFSKCCGQAHAHRVFSDPLVRDLMHIDAALSPVTVAQWQRRISQEHLAMFMQTISAWQRERDAVEGQTLMLSRATLPGSSVAVLLDGSRGIWLAAKSYQRNRLERLVERLHGQLLQYDQAETVLLSTEMFVEVLRSAYPSLHIEALHSDVTIQKVEEDQALKEVLMRLDKLTSELSYLSMPSAFHLSRSLDLALSVVAQGIMRLFAWRLPGFARSSLPYLYSNFLDIPGSLEDEPTRRVVRVGEPPLNFILNLTGMNRSTYRISWLDERPFALFREE